MRILFFSIVILFFSCGCFAQSNFFGAVLNIDELVEAANPEGWKTYKSKKGVSLKYRWLHFNEKDKTRQLSLHFKSSKKVSELIKLIKNPEKVRYWNSSVREQVIFDDDSLSWISHTVFAIPYPLNQQDLVVQNTISNKQRAVLVDAYAVPTYLEDLESTKRQQFYLSQWRFTQQKGNELDVEFTLVSMSKSAIPRWIRDPIVLNRLLNSFIELKNWNDSNH